MSKRPQDRLDTSGARLILASGFQPDYVRETANAYARLGCAVAVIGGDMHAGAAYEPGVAFLNLRGAERRAASLSGEFRKLAIYYFRLLWTVARSPSPMVYDVSIGRPFLRCALMYTIFNVLGRAVVHTAHNVVPHDRDTRINRLIYRIIYRLLSTRIVVHGESLRDRLVMEFGVPRERILVAPHGTYHPRRRPEVDKAIARRQLHMRPTDRVVLVFGLQRPYKGTDFLLDAVAHSRISGLRIVIRGEAPDTAYRHRLESLIASVPRSTKVDALFKPANDDEVELIFKAADVVALPYLEGSQSGVKFMAYAYGRPVLVSDVGSLAECLVPGLTGERFRPGDERSFVQRLDHMLANIADYQELAIQKYAYKHWSFDGMVAAVETVCNPIRKAPKSPRLSPASENS